MIAAYMDVMAEVPLADINAMLDHGQDVQKEILELLRTTADRRCHAAGARLRTDSPPELMMKRGITLTGQDVFLVAARFPVDAPIQVTLP